ncbi:Homoserine dehydrogenase [Ammonifex degensii KC4]|uniref:Homoserine dehydrogenase n=1 Tax=Ammonifex degensii (strain DSM 10501 / KC4) TaxID=429009 RepID=C9RCP3_AMMDK|nr:homoserine dehydrogenase [Ammonifex degensii]ACX52020.1 Homoserine dehydrogenase [Ammonifex degensii KC4]
MRSFGIGLLGLGTVGRGVYRVLQENGEIIASRLGARLEVVKILVRDPKKDRGLAVPPELLTTDPQEVISHPAVDIVVEVMGGVEPARRYVLQALEQGKMVVTANKDLLALHGRELFDVASAARTDLFFEASVAGGIPIIKILKESLAANRIREIIGIINGTTNYILTRMSEEGLDFALALSEAQKHGYAEADPRADIEGLDAARKIAILASIAFNSRVTFPEVYAEGISRIEPADIKYARELGYTIKLLALARETEKGLEVRVHPALVSFKHPLASVRDVFNAVFVRGDAVGETMFYGRGAGELPTASAVVGDIMTAARQLLHGVKGMWGCTCFEQKPLVPVEETESCFYLRIKAVDRPGVLAGIAGAFGRHEVSLAAVIQKTTGEVADLVLVTHRVKEANLRAAEEELKKLPTVEAVANVIRVLEE